MPNYIQAPQSDLKYQEENKNVILLVGSHAKLADCFIHALQNEFPHCDVIYCKDIRNIEQLRLSTIKLVNLVIVHHLLNDNNIDQITGIKNLFPSQPVALAYNCTDASSMNVRLFGEHFDSHLPMDVKLDVWLSIIRLIMSGGNYVCPELLKEQYQTADKPCQSTISEYKAPLIAKSEGTSPAPSPKSNSNLGKLTERETDVIKLMAAGQQNKIIAASLDLSEHTVKLHIHHIISKLNVSNRTEAAALFLNASRFGEEHC